MGNKVTVTFTVDENKDVSSCVLKGDWMEESESMELLKEDNVEKLTEIKDYLYTKAVFVGIEELLRGE